MINFRNFLFEKKKMKTLYVKRALELNCAEKLVEWAKEHGIKETLLPEDMHVTVAFSREPVNWSKVHLDKEMHIADEAVHDRNCCHLGNEGAFVLKFKDNYLESRWLYFCKQGASWDHESYIPHVSLSYNAPPDLDLDDYYPNFPIVLEGEERSQVDLDWKATVKEE